MSWANNVPGFIVRDPEKLQQLMDASEIPMIRRDPNEPEPPLIMENVFELEPPRKDLIWAAVDLDGTLAEGVWTPDNPTADIGDLIPGVREKVQELVDAGMKIVVHTARAWTDYQNIEKWLIHNQIPFKTIVCGKLLAKVYIDDRAVSAFEDSWLPERNKK